MFGYRAEEVRQGTTAHFLIQGENLWRSTRVTLGSQATRDIEILPDMRGIIATFDEITEPVNIDGTAREGVPLRVWTSEGVAPVGEVTIHPPKTIKIDVAFEDSRLVGDGKKVAVKLKLEKDDCLLASTRWRWACAART